MTSWRTSTGTTNHDGGKFASDARPETRWSVSSSWDAPLARLLDDGWTAGVTRCCVSSAAPRNACSFLYGAAWRAWRALGGKTIMTYTLMSESGASLCGAGWRVVGQVRPGDWSPEVGPDAPVATIYRQQRFRWEATA